MKIPYTPPDPENLFLKIAREDQEKFTKIFDLKPEDQKGRYLHWEELRHKTPPYGLKPEEYWAGVKFARRKIEKITGFRDKSGKPFIFVSTDGVQKDLHWLDKNTAGTISTGSLGLNREMKDEYVVNTLIDEAFHSSQIEGAMTTKKVAEEMLRRKRRPRDKSEQMIFNNYLAMDFIKRNIEEPLSKELVFEFHKILTKDTLDNEEAAGAFRKSDDFHVFDALDNETVHVPPKASELEERMGRLCSFANMDEDEDEHYIHPMLKAIMLHFMLAYDHPFEDGNGRTARALFYWYALKSGYWLMEFISISRIIKRSLRQYGRAYLYTETDNNDLTYFIIYQLTVIRKGVEEVFDYLKRKMEETKNARRMLESSPKLKAELNFRQLSLLRSALKHPNATYTIKGHANSHGVVYQTARTDLLALSDKYGLLEKEKVGREFIFVSPRDLEKRLKGE